MHPTTHHVILFKQEIVPVVVIVLTHHIIPPLLPLCFEQKVWVYFKLFFVLYFFVFLCGCPPCQPHYSDLRYVMALRGIALYHYSVILCMPAI